VPPGTSHAAAQRGRGDGDGAAAAFAQPGQTIDVTVSSMGNAKSLRGGTLIATPLKGADGQIYALAQGNLIVGGAGASAGGSKVQINHLSAGRVPEGATVERSVPTPLLQGERCSWTSTPRLRHRARGGRAINEAKGAGTAARWTAAACACACRRARRTRVASWPTSRTCRCAGAARGARGAQCAHRLGGDERRRHAGPCAVAHGNLSVTISTTPVVSQPNPLAGGQTVAEKSDIAITQQGGSLMQMPAGAKLADVVKALNALGATPQDLLAILQAMKSAGALHAEIEVI
jgi:flagellar P-ring protein FlgI